MLAAVGSADADRPPLHACGGAGRRDRRGLGRNAAAGAGVVLPVRGPSPAENSVPVLLISVGILVAIVGGAALSARLIQHRPTPTPPPIPFASADDRAEELTP